MAALDQQRTGTLAIQPLATSGPTRGLNLYLVFVVSWFLHMGSRVPALGIIRFDLLLVIVLIFLALAHKEKASGPATATDKLLRTLILFSILTIPFVEWPGSVLNRGIPEFIKAVVFYYFTVAFVRSEKDLRKFVMVFLACQIFRVLEPLYLHITQGYWGSFASMGNWEYLARLSGAPSDVVNPNGLAFIIVTVLPFLYFLAGHSRVNRLVAVCVTPFCLYALALTSSRTGFLALIVVVLSILVKTRNRLSLILVSILVIAIGFPLLSADQQDRYLSVFGMGEKNRATVDGRIEGVQANFQVALRKPIVGHGLGTSLEANANFGGIDQPAHNLYAEVFTELGFVGLVIFLLFMKSILSGYAECKRTYVGVSDGSFTRRIVNAMQVWLWMNLLFSLASYGVSSYEWYLMGGISVVMQRILVADKYARTDLK